MKNLQAYPGPKGTHRTGGAAGPSAAGDNQADNQAPENDLSKNGFWTIYATDYGLREYHVKGW